MTFDLCPIFMFLNGLHFKILQLVNIWKFQTGFVQMVSSGNPFLCLKKNIFYVSRYFGFSCCTWRCQPWCFFVFSPFWIQCFDNYLLMSYCPLSMYIRILYNHLKFSAVLYLFPICFTVNVSVMTDSKYIIMTKCICLDHMLYILQSIVGILTMFTWCALRFPAA